MTLSAEHRLYLIGRGITPPTAEAFGLSSSDRGIVIPFEGASKTYIPNGKPKISWTEPLDGAAPPFPSYDVLRQSELIVEGEWDAVLATQELGQPVASPSCGAGTWLDEWSDALTGRSVTLLYDNDESGKKGAQKAAESLHRAGVSVHIASWPTDLPKGYDISDFFRDGGTPDGLREILSGATPFLPPGLSKGMGEFLTTKVIQKPMLIEGIWPSAAIGYVGGSPKALKSWWTLEMALAVATGKKFLGKYQTHQARVLLVQQESSWAAFQRRVQAVSQRYGNSNELFILSNHALDLVDDAQAEKLEEEIRRVRPDLVVLDPFASFYSGDENSAKEVGAIVRLLRGWRDTYGTGICVVHHANKSGSENIRGGEKLRGTSALYGSSEATIYLTRKEDEDMTASRVKIELKESEAPYPFEITLDRETTLLHVVTSGETLKRNLDYINGKPKTVIPHWTQEDMGLVG